MAEAAPQLAIIPPETGDPGGPVLCVRNWARFQHYHQRNPPWIRLYNSLLDDYQFARLQDASKWQACGIWLLASRFDNAIPDDATWIAQRINARSPVDIEALISAGFIERYPSASAALAARKQSATPEESREETEERQRREEKKKRAGARAPGRKHKEKTPAEKSWTAKACDSWMAQLDGTPPGGRIGQALKPLIAKYGETDVLENWGAYLTTLVAQGRGAFATPADFAGRYGYYKEHGTRRPDNGRPARTQAAADEQFVRNRQAIDSLDLTASKGALYD
jgi:ribosomal protein L12E/L44/L45/RPP1/RPP2